MSLVRAAAAGLLAVASLGFLAGLLLVTRPTPPGGSGPAAAVGVEATAEIAATSQAIAPSPSPQPSTPQAEASLVPLAPAESPEAPPDRRGSFSLVDSAPATIDLTRISSSVVLGSVTGVGPGQWNTKDGRLPTGEDLMDPFDVMRLLRVDVERQLGYQGAATTLIVRIRGGTIGCASFTDSEFPNVIEPGQRFVLFLDGWTPPRNGLVGVQRVELMWPVDQEGRVATPEDGTLTIEELATRVAAAERQAE
ncbi:MAG: hypothetical protein H0X59_05535 [Chloroflexi bacterium]|nr:hypothetical protein [Chloroflexota bacterium]